MSKHIRQEVRVAIDENNPAIVRDEDLCVECRICGHLVVGTKAPEVCPVCGYSQAYFEVRAENY